MCNEGYAGVGNLESMEKAVRYNAYLQGLIDREIRAVKTSKKPKVVDFGAGLGQFALPTRKRLKNSGCVVAIEKDEKLRKRLKEKMGGSCFSDLDELDAESVDLIYSLNVLEHIENDSETILKMYEKTKRGGRLLIYVPAFPCLFSAMDRLVGHHRRYRREGLTAQIIGVGYRVTMAHYVDSLGFPASMAYKIFSGKSGRIDPESVGAYDRFVFPVSQIADKVLMNSIGKNLLVVAEK